MSDLVGTIEGRAAAVEAFDRDGYVVLRSFMTQEQIDQINQRIEALIERAPKLDGLGAFYEQAGDRSSIMRLQSIEQFDGVLRGLYHGDQLRTLAGDMLQTPSHPTSLQWFGKPSRIGGPTPPHQDGFYFQLEPSEALTFWLSLDHADEGNGCVRYIPGSHKGGFRPHTVSDVVGFSRGITDYGDADYAVEQAVVTAPGDMIIHHCDIIHRADNNESDRSRPALGMVFYSDRARQSESAESVAELAKADAARGRWKAEGRA